MVFLGLIIVLVHINAELDFLDGDDLLVFFGFALPLFLLIKILAEVHDASHRGLRGRRNLHQVQVFFTGDLEGFERLKYAELIALVVNYAKFASPNALICANKPLIDNTLLKA